MRGRIPEDTLAEVRARASIVEVVGAHVGLRRVGRNHVGLCPFHAEKTPSFTVSEERAIFHCFGCGVGGNVFTFLMRMENLPFPEAVERLAQRYGVALPERGETDPTQGLREAMFRLNEKTARFYQRVLWDAGEAAPARAYLEERGVGRASAERFLLGYAPAAGDVLVRRLRGASLPLEVAVRLGLIGARQGNGHYDRFRARLMFPITDASGRVVGFGSRSVPGTASATGDLPKYLNSPETPLYRKGAHLYALAAARDAIRTAGRALVVEGYFDVLGLAEAGIGNVVASLGTALTLEQLRLLRRFTRDIVVFFDGDPAGEKAAEKSLETFLEAGLWGHGAFLPRGDDPDTFVRRAGREAALALLGAATSLLDFYLERAVRPGSTIAERAAVAQTVAPLLGKIADPFEYNMAVRRAAERLAVSEDLLRCRPAGRRESVPVHQAPAVRAPGAEELLVTLMLRDPAAAARVEAAGGLALFAEEAWRTLAADVIESVRSGGGVDVAGLLSRLDDAAAARIAGRLLATTGGGAETSTLVDECLAKLRRQADVRRREVLRREIRQHEARGDHPAVERALRELDALRQEEGGRRDEPAPVAAPAHEEARSTVPEATELDPADPESDELEIGDWT